MPAVDPGAALPFLQTNTGGFFVLLVCVGVLGGAIALLGRYYVNDLRSRIAAMNTALNDCHRSHGECNIRAAKAEAAAERAEHRAERLTRVCIRLHQALHDSSGQRGITIPGIDELLDS